MKRIKNKNNKLKIISGLIFSTISVAIISSTIISCATNNNSNFKYQSRIYIVKNLSDEYGKLSIHATVATRTNSKYLLQYQWYKENTDLVTNNKTSQELVSISTPIKNANLDYYVYSNNKENGYWIYFVKISGYIVLKNKTIVQLTPVYSRQEEVYSYTSYSNLNNSVNSTSNITNQTAALSNWSDLWSKYSQSEKSGIIKSTIYSYLNYFDVVDDKLINIKQTIINKVIYYLIYKNVDVENIDVNLNSGYLSYSIITKYGYADFSNSNLNGSNLPNNGIDVNNFFINVKRYYFTNLTFTPTLVKYGNNYYAGLKINGTQAGTTTSVTVPFQKYNGQVTKVSTNAKQILAMNWNLPFVYSQYLQNMNNASTNPIMYYMYQNLYLYATKTLQNETGTASYTYYSILNSQNILNTYNGGIDYGILQ